MAETGLPVGLEALDEKQQGGGATTIMAFGTIYPVRPLPRKTAITGEHDDPRVWLWWWYQDYW